MRGISLPFCRWVVKGEDRRSKGDSCQWYAEEQRVKEIDFVAQKKKGKESRIVWMTIASITQIGDRKRDYSGKPTDKISKEASIQRFGARLHQKQAGHLPGLEGSFHLRHGELIPGDW